MSGKFSQLLIIIIFGTAVAMLGYRELSNKHFAQFKGKVVPQEQIEKVKAIFGTDVDIKKASFDKETAQRASSTVEQRKQDPKSELKTLMRLILPEKNDQKN